MHKKASKITVSKEALATHFGAHFGATALEMPVEIEHPERFPELHDEKFEINENPPSLTEVEEAARTFKNNKSSGTDKIPTEALKYQSSPRLLANLVLLLSMVWSLMAVPSDWLHSSITCLYKKGLKSLASNYRALSVGANLSKYLPRIILKRFETAYESSISESQFGFRRGRSTADAIYVCKTLLDKTAGTVVVIFVDLTAAYDKIDRAALFRLISLRTGAPKLTALLYAIYQHTTASICGSKAKFEILAGCRQGGLESPCLFNYYFDFCLKVCAKEIDEALPDGWGLPLKYRVAGECFDRKRDGRMSGADMIRWILYADDLALFCRSVQEAQIVMDILHRVCTRFGLTISFKKNEIDGFRE